MPRSRIPTLSPATHLVQELAEHLEVGRDGLAGVVDPDDLDLTHLGELALFDPARDDRAATGDREHVLDRHQERLLDVAHRLGDVGVARLHQLVDLGDPRLVALQGLERRYLDDRGVVAGELVGGQQLADLELDELQELGVIHRVALVERHDDVGDADLAGEQDVLARLGHGAVGRRYHQDRAVDLGGAGDHVLDVVGVPGHVDVGVVAVVGLVLHVGDRDRDAALALLGGLVDLVERGELRQALVGLALGDRGRERGLAVVDMAHRADVHVGLRALELLLRHGPSFPRLFVVTRRSPGR